MDEPGIADLKTVVTEACMNVVVHAYRRRAGPARGRGRARRRAASPSSSATTGSGIRPRPDVEQPSLRTRPLADRRPLQQLRDLRRRSTAAPRSRCTCRCAAAAPTEGGRARRRSSPGRRDRDRRSATPSSLAPILGRVVGALAARRDLTVDRVSDAMLLTDAIAAGAPRALRRRPRARSASPSATTGSSCGSGRWKTAAPSGSAREPRACPRSAARWRRWPTSSRSSEPTTASTSSSASASLAA